jgi:hypothetical protein
MGGSLALHSNKARLSQGMLLWSSHTACLNMAMCAAFCIALALTGQNCAAQQLPLAPEPQTASVQPRVKLALSLSAAPVSYSSSATPAFVPSSSYNVIRQTHNPPIADKKYFLINGLHLGMAVLDVELTQRCIASHQCREGNPLMPSSQAGQLSVNIGYVALGAFASYELKKRRSQFWWLAPAGGIAGHLAGAATGLSH